MFVYIATVKPPLSRPPILGTSIIYLVFNVIEDLHINACVSGIKRYVCFALNVYLIYNRYGALYIDREH